MQYLIRTKMLGHFEHQPWGSIGHFQGIEDWRQTFVELYIHHGSNNSHYFSRATRRCLGFSCCCRRRRRRVIFCKWFSNQSIRSNCVTHWPYFEHCNVRPACQLTLEKLSYHHKVLWPKPWIRLQFTLKNWVAISSEVWTPNPLVTITCQFLLHPVQTLMCNQRPTSWHITI